MEENRPLLDSTPVEVSFRGELWEWRRRRRTDSEEEEEEEEEEAKILCYLSLSDGQKKPPQKSRKNFFLQDP